MSDITKPLNPDIEMMLPYHLTNKVSNLLAIKLRTNSGIEYRGWAEANEFYEQLSKETIEFLSEEFGILTFKRTDISSYAAVFIMKSHIN